MLSVIDGDEGITVGSSGQGQRGDLPNVRLRTARETTPSSIAPGESMSRGELADAVNAHLWRTTGRRHALDAHTLARYERGTIRWPTSAYRSGLRAVLQVTSDDQLGFRPPDRSTSAGVGSTSERMVSITSHQFVPLLVGPGPDIATPGLQRCEILGIDGVRGPVPHPTASAEMVVFPWGVAVLHLTEAVCADDLVSVASWRRNSYCAAKTFAATVGSQMFGSRVTQPAYVMSTYWVDEPAWASPELDAAMRLLCMLRVLLPSGTNAEDDHLTRARSLERRLLREGFQHDGVVSFGVDGLSVGYASWAGVSYCPLVPRERAARRPPRRSRDPGAGPLDRLPWRPRAGRGARRPDPRRRVRLAVAARRAVPAHRSPPHGEQPARGAPGSGSPHQRATGRPDRRARRAARLAGRPPVTPNSSVLVVVDMQNGFVSSRSRPIVPRVVDLVRRWTASHRPVVFTRFVNPPDSPYETLIGWTRMRADPETAIVDELGEFAAKAVATLQKPSYTAFTEEGAALIAEHGWTDLVLCGIATESCVLKTACDAFERGLVPWIVTDACYSHAGEEPHAAGLLVAGRFIGRRQLITTEDAVGS